MTIDIESIFNKDKTFMLENRYSLVKDKHAWIQKHGHKTHLNMPSLPKWFTGGKL